MKHAKRQENTAHHEEINQSTGIDPKLTQILELTDKEIQTAIGQNIRERHGKYKKDPNWISKDENYSVG